MVRLFLGHIVFLLDCARASTHHVIADGGRKDCKYCPIRHNHKSNDKQPAFDVICDIFYNLLQEQPLVRTAALKLETRVLEGDSAEYEPSEVCNFINLYPDEFHWTSFSMTFVIN